MNIFDCVPEFYRSEQEKFDRECEKQHRFDNFYEECKWRIKYAHRCGYPLISFGGHGACQKCTKHSGEMMTNSQDDMCRIICYDKNCKYHKIYDDIHRCSVLISELAKLRFTDNDVTGLEFTTDYKLLKFKIKRYRGGFNVSLNNNTWYAENFDDIYDVTYMLLEDAVINE